MKTEVRDIANSTEAQVMTHTSVLAHAIIVWATASGQESADGAELGVSAEPKNDCYYIPPPKKTSLREDLLQQRSKETKKGSTEEMRKSYEDRRERMRERKIGEKTKQIRDTHIH